MIEGKVFMDDDGIYRFALEGYGMYSGDVDYVNQGRLATEKKLEQDREFRVVRVFGDGSESVLQEYLPLLSENVATAQESS